MYPDVTPLEEQEVTITRGSFRKHLSEAVCDNNRCLSDGMGSNLGRQVCQRFLGTSLDLGAHQCVGAQVSLPLSESFSPIIAKQTCFGKVQYVCIVSHQTQVKKKLKGSEHTRSYEQSSRPAVSNWTSSERVASPSRSGKICMGTIQYGEDQSVCNGRDSSLQSMVIPEQPGRSNGISRMAGRVVVCFSSSTFDSLGAQEGSTVSSQSLACGPKIAKETLVLDTCTFGSRSSLAATKESRSSVSSGEANLAPEARDSTIVGVASTQSLSMDLDEAVLRTINSSKAPSIWSNYSSKWWIFSAWCQDHLLDATNCGTSFVLRFLRLLLDSGRSVNTIKVYISAISHFHSLVDGVSVGKYSLVSQFLNGTYHLWPRNIMRSPAWNLIIVLHSLVKAPFEPLDQANLKFLTWKTVFLLPICSAKRVSELHSLSVSEDCLGWKAENAGIYLWPNPSFLPKVPWPGMINQGIDLDAFLPDPSCSGTGLDISFLCSVRALRTYIEHTRPLRQSHKQLFVCFDKKCAVKPVSKQRLSHWIVDTISQAYSSQNLPVPGDLVAHSTRSMATSWAELKGGSTFGHMCHSLLEHPVHI